MKLPTLKYDSLHYPYNYSGPKDEVNWFGTIAMYVGGIAVTALLTVGIFFLLYASGFWLGFYSVPCQFSQSQPKCSSWRTQRNDQHINGNLNLNVKPNGGKP